MVKIKYMAMNLDMKSVLNLKKKKKDYGTRDDVVLE